MTLMLGLLVGIGGSVVVVLMNWRTYKRVADPAECKVIEEFMKLEQVAWQPGAVVASRPQMLLEELALVRDSADKQIAAFNDALSEVDSSTRLGLRASKSTARVAFIVGVAGATLEIVSHSGSMGPALLWAMGALAPGLAGAAVCTVIGQRAIGAQTRRRQLWDDFVRWILNSRFPQTEFNVLGVHQKDVSEGQTRSTQAQ